MDTLAGRATRTIALALIALLVLGTFAVGNAQAAGPRQQYEKRLLNHTRRDYGRRSVHLHRRLNRIAREHSRKMARQDRLYHSENLVEKVRRMHWRRLGENVGVAPQMGHRTLKEMHEAFMNSRSHRKNILLRAFRRIGVGIVQRNGKVWVTVIFLG